MSGQVNVEVDAAPQADLSAVMAGIREQYENASAKNQRALESWFNSKVSFINTNITSKCEITPGQIKNQVTF